MEQQQQLGENLGRAGDSQTGAVTVHLLLTENVPSPQYHLSVELGPLHCIHLRS